jgi:hypothetical protein
VVVGGGWVKFIPCLRLLSGIPFCKCREGAAVACFPSTKTSEFCHDPQAFSGVPWVRLARPGNALTLVILF